MSYPRQITVVAVEDEISSRERYEDIFNDYAADQRTAPLKLLGSCEEAMALLAGDTIVHLLVLDLGLPLPARGTADSGVEPGFTILEAAAKREHLPIPAVLVISGRMNQASQTGLREHLKEFWYAEALTKSVDDDEMEIQKALEKVDEYTGIGIHIRDGGRQSPTLAPREDDLLRRCALQNDAIGLDLRWWSGHSVQMPPSLGGNTRVLVGEFLLDRGMQRSRTTFFKFEPSAYAGLVHRDARIMEQKLPHVKVVCSMKSRTRALLATQTVATSTGETMSLQDLLERPATEVVPMLPRIVGDVCKQLDQLGATANARRRVSQLIWPHHDAAKIKEVWTRFGGDRIAPECDPAALVGELKVNQNLVWVHERPCNHGDLNPTNVAVEVIESDGRGYIFDAGGIQNDAAFRDLAYLEVTSLLHCRTRHSRELIDQCQSLYSRPECDQPAQETPCSVRSLIECIRQAAESCESEVYALLVLDAALVQLGGLAFETMPNKISDPTAAVRLVELVIDWYRCGAQLMPDPGNGTTSREEA